jgi:site-specific DNA recombinase
MATAAKPRPLVSAIRCAIYTRKSTEEGLDSDFNTLDAQRESAEAYIVSQRHEGWIALPQKYDDGGFTGANMERPALKRLLDDVRSGLVNCVVVYKVDRLTRSLLDFARIVEVFDQHGTTFVSVTQQFNTTASLGRLTLNILLSFAQFEREMISERTRDKMSAARRKGKWTGGNPVLGYDVHPDGGSLVVNAEEAARVRTIFELYLRLGSLLPLVTDLNRREWTLKRWTTREGKIVGGKPFTRARLHQLLTNVIYTGQVRHRGEVYPGEHEAIVDRETWEKVHAQLKAHAPSSNRSLRNKHGALLKGIVRCASCNAAMVHTYTQKGPRLYRYYVCVKAHQQGWAQCATRSVSAPELEQAVIDQIRGIGRNPMMLTAVMKQLEESGCEEASRQEVARALQEFDGLWRELSPREQEQVIKSLVERVSYDGRTGTVTVGFRSAGLKQLCLLQEVERA